MGNIEEDMQRFINEHRDCIDNFCIREHGYSPDDDEDRENIVRNDETMYNWAKNEGVEV